MTIADWKSVPGDEDIRYEKSDGIAEITIIRPEVRHFGELRRLP